jgi:GT2 family glycosyltransferase
MKPKATIVTVNYKSVLSTVEFLDSLSHTKAFSEIAVVIADNSSGEEDLSSIRQAIAQLPNVELLVSAVNRGYFGAAGFALEHYLAQGRGLPDWLIVCNHDVLIEDPDFFSKLFSQDPMAVGVIAPRIQILPKGLDQNPFMRYRPGRVRWEVLRLAYSSYGLAVIWDWMSRLKKALKTSRWVPGRGAGETQILQSEPIYAAHGSFVIFSRRYFEKGGYLDGNLFLYGEEISVAEICRTLHLPIVYEPSLRVLHDEHRSTGKTISRFSYECQKKALRYIMEYYLHGLRGIANSRKAGLPQ